MLSKNEVLQLLNFTSRDGIYLYKKPKEIHQMKQLIISLLIEFRKVFLLITFFS